jgi:hypothetical protein
MSWAALVVATVLCGVSVVRGFQGQTFMGRALGGDFVAFYVTGKILNQHEPGRIYDLGLEVPLQHETVPDMPKTQMLPFAHAPYIGQAYRPFAALPYRWAYVAWLVFSMGLYAAGVLLTLRSAQLTPAQMKIGFLLALSSMTFIMETWIGGQISVLGFFFIALFVYCRANQRRFFAGMALALALSKLTLVAAPIAMLVFGRRWRMLAGVAAGTATAAAISVATVGVKGCVAWVGMLRFFSHLAAGSEAALRRTKYVDMGSFFRLLFGHTSTPALVLGTVVTVAGVGILAIAWTRSSSWSAASRDLLWAATLTGSLIFNVYTPIYDTITVSAAAALVAGALRGRPGEDSDVFRAWLALLWIVPWVTQAFAEFLRFQLFTMVLAGFAYWALRLAYRGTGEHRTGCPAPGAARPTS